MKLAVVVDDAAVAARVRAESAAAGWFVTDGWTVLRGEAVMVLGTVNGREDAAACVTAAVAGAAVVATLNDRTVGDELCDNLDRVAELRDWRGDRRPPRLEDDSRALVNLLLDGMTVRSAARSQHLSDRTAERRLAAARDAFGVATTPALLAAAARFRIPGPDLGHRTGDRRSPG